VIHHGADGWSFTDDPYYMYDSAGRLVRQTPVRGEEMDLFPGNYRAGDPLDALFYTGWYQKMLARATPVAGADYT